MLPVKSDARAGEQTGEVQKKLSNRMPSAASLSRTGVRISGLPPQPSAQGPWSSLTMNRTLGRPGSLLAMWRLLVAAILTLVTPDACIDVCGVDLHNRLCNNAIGLCHLASLRASGGRLRQHGP